MKNKSSKLKIKHKYWKNNWILFSLSFLICVSILGFILLNIYHDSFSMFVKVWETIVTSFFFLILYFIFFCCYIFYEKIKVKKDWTKKKKKEIEELQEKNKKDDFVNYNHAIEEIILKINDLFKHQNNTRYTTNILIIKGEYGTGKTFIMSEVLKKFEKMNNYTIIILTYQQLKVNQELIFQNIYLMK